MSKTNTRLVLLICLVLTGSVLAVYWPVTRHSFINYDDSQYVIENTHVTTGLTWENIKWAFSAGYASNWHPLTWISHMLDVQLFGLKPGAHHITNLIFHTANTLLLFLVLRRMTGAIGRSAFVAALFALHPLHVESVAWVAERKDVLSGFFFMLTLLAYAKYVERRKETSNLKLQTSEKSQHSNFKAQQERAALISDLRPLISDSWRWYVLSLVLFALGLMSKPMLVTLPFVLLLLDLWPLGRLRIPGRDAFHSVPTGLKLVLVEKIPFFALSIASSVITFLVQRGAMSSPIILPMSDRADNALFAYIAYLRQTFWPTRLAIFYPYPADFPETELVAYSALLLALTVAAVLWLRRRPYIAVGWFWFVGMLIPVLGLVQVGAQSRADRYTYLSLIGIFVVVAWGLMEIVRSRDRWSRTMFVGGIVVLLLCGWTARRQVGFWENSETLFTHANEVTPDNYIALAGLGIVEIQRNQYEPALNHLHQALVSARAPQARDTIKYYIATVLQKQGKGLEALPYLEEADQVLNLRPERYYHLGLSLIEAGRLPEAEEALRKAVELRPGNPEFQLGMAALLHSRGQSDRAEQVYRDITAHHPKLPLPHRSYGDFLMLQNRALEAETQYQAAIALEPANVELRMLCGGALVKAGKSAEAAAQLKEAVKLDPTNAQANFQLAELLSNHGQSADAIAYYEQALKSDPRMVSALNNLAWVLATDSNDKVRNGNRAIELAKKACELTQWKTPLLIGTLAAAYAEAGNFQEAVTMAEKARDQARAEKEDGTARRNEELAQLYRSGKPYHEKQ
jgi:protein O-mannosyl-transferase